MSDDDEQSVATVFEYDEFEWDQRDILEALCAIDGEFHGSCVDTAAQRSVIGKLHAQAFCQISRVQFQLKDYGNGRIYKFDDQRFTSLGYMPIRIPVGDTSFLKFEFEVVDVDVSLHVGMEFLDSFSVSIDIGRSKLVGEDNNWKVDLQRRRGHMYIVWNHDEIL